jgi:hypothetical protein
VSARRLFNDSIRYQSAAAGDTMNVCPGVYPEDVVITKKLTLAGINQKHQLGVPTIVYPGKSDKPLCSAETYGVCPQIFVNEATVKITGMRIDDSAFPADTCFGTPMGILFLNAGGMVSSNTVVIIRQRAMKHSPATVFSRPIRRSPVATRFKFRVTL